MFESVFSIISIIAVVAVFGFYFLIKKKESKDWIYAVYFLTVIIIGTVIFSLALSYKQDSDTTFSPLFIFAKALASVLRSFGGDFNASTLAKISEANSLFAVAAFVNYIAAVVLTFLISIKLFGKNLVNKIRVFINSHSSNYILIGTSGQAEIFLSSLDYKKRHRTTVILETKQKDKKKDLMFKGYAVVIIKDSQEGFAEKSGSKKDITKETYAALKLAGFNRNKKNTKIIAMSEDDEVNLLVAKIVTDHVAGIIKPTKGKNGRIDKLSLDQEVKLEAIKLSAHIMYESLERAEHFAFAEYALGMVRFFNPYEVRARKFMLENPITSLIPNEWINTKKARLYNANDEGHDKPYKIGNFFIGYGFTNQHILKKSICNYQILGTDYNALIIDKNAKKLEKQFQNSAPGLFNEVDKNGQIVLGSELLPNVDDTLYFPNPEEKYNIEFADLNVLSADFYKRVVSEIIGSNDKQGLDFVSIVIALGSDKLSIETALELRQKLYERKLLKVKIGDNFRDRVRIFVKIMKNSVLSDYNILNDENDINSKIIVFGAADEILTEGYIIHEELDFIARRIANDYWKISGAETQKTNFVSKWDTLTEFKRDSNRYAAMSISTKLNLLGFQLVEGLAKTTDKIINTYESAYGTAISLEQRAERASGRFVDFSERDKDGNIIDKARNNLARLEHQRWNTLHLLSGWTKLTKAEATATDRQDEKTKQHACITTFEGLSELRNKQVAEALEQSEKNGETILKDKAQSDADTVCYDFNVMDRLFGNLYHSNFCVVLREDVL